MYQTENIIDKRHCGLYRDNQRK